MKKYKVYWERFKRALRVKGGEVTDLVNQKQDALLEPEDPIYQKKLHPDPEPDKGVLTRGGIDVWFFLIVLGLILYGVIMAYSASSIYAAQYHDDSTYFIKKHLMYLALAVVATAPFVFMARPWFWKFFAICAYGGSVVLLLAVLVMGTMFGGANRWIAIGPITIQPSEIAKMSLIMFLALFMSKYQKEINTVQKFGGHFTYGVVGPVVIIGIICGLVMLEKHLSGLIILGVLGIVVMYLGGTKLKWFAGIGVAGVTVVGLHCLYLHPFYSENFTVIFSISRILACSAWANANLSASEILGLLSTERILATEALILFILIRCASSFVLQRFKSSSYCFASASIARIV